MLSEATSTSTTSTSKSNNSTTPSASTSNAVGASDNNKKTASLLLDLPEEVLVPGALYADCAVVVNLAVKLDKNPDMQVNDDDDDAEGKKSGAAMGTNTNKKKSREEEVVELPDDGEYGGELAGRLVWEAYEAGLKVWEKEDPTTTSRPVEEEKGRKKEEGRNASSTTGKRTQTNDEREREVEKDAYL